MLSEYVERIGAYIRKVEDEWKSGRATEPTYRPMLKELVEALMTRITVVNEPKHIECGAPDYLLRRGADILGFIEAKDIGDGDLDGRTVNKEQFNCYKDSLDNLCFTDYLDFHFYDHGDFVDLTNPFANPYAKFEGVGEGQVEKVGYDDGKVYINGGQWFANVPEAAWNFFIGGYQPAQKWLKDRKGCILTSEDQQHYRAIIAALMKTDELMKAL